MSPDVNNSLHDDAMYTLRRTAALTRFKNSSIGARMVGRNGTYWLADRRAPRTPNGAGTTVGRHVEAGSGGGAAAAAAAGGGAAAADAAGGAGVAAAAAGGGGGGPGAAGITCISLEPSGAVDKGRACGPRGTAEGVGPWITPAALRFSTARIPSSITDCLAGTAFPSPAAIIKNRKALSVLMISTPLNATP